MHQPGTLYSSGVDTRGFHYRDPTYDPLFLTFSLFSCCRPSGNSWWDEYPQVTHQSIWRQPKAMKIASLQLHYGMDFFWQVTKEANTESFYSWTVRFKDTSHLSSWDGVYRRTVIKCYVSNFCSFQAHPRWIQYYHYASFLCDTFYWKILSWPKNLFEFFHTILWKNLNEPFGQPNSSYAEKSTCSKYTTQWCFISWT